MKSKIVDFIQTNKKALDILKYWHVLMKYMKRY